jgi:hypothetical protein
VQFKPPTPPSTSSRKDYLDSKTIFSPRLITPPLLWDMEIYGTTKVHRQYLGAVGTFELDDFIQKFDNWCDMQQIHNP